VREIGSAVNAVNADRPSVASLYVVSEIRTFRPVS
jgi:hypothetical protein